MISRRTGILAITAAAAVLAAGLAGVPESDAAKTQMYEVTVTNISPGQPITPPLIVTHSKDVSIFTVGEEASEGLQQLAENGNSSLITEALDGAEGVLDVVKGTTGHLVAASNPGDNDLEYAETFMVSAEGNMRYISFASMLVCTNDGFAGVDSVKLPFFKEKTVYAKAYDARTEMNTEDFDDLVPPCAAETGVESDKAGSKATNPDLAEDGVVIPHAGVYGDADLSERVHGWDGPVVKIDIVRMS